MTKSQPGLYELLRQRSLKRRLGEDEAEGLVSSGAAEVATLERGPSRLVEEPRRSIQLEEPEPMAVEAMASEESFEVPAAPRTERSTLKLWQRGIWLSAPVLAAISLLGAVMVFAGYQLGYSRGTESGAPDLWAGSGGTPRNVETAQASGSFVGIRAGTFDDAAVARQYAGQLNRSGQFPMQAEVYESADGQGPVELVLGNFASEAEAKRSGILDRLREWQVGEGSSAQKPFDKAEFRYYALGN